MNAIDDLKIVYKKTTSITLKKIKKNPVVLILPAIYSMLLFFVNNLMFTVIGGTGMGLGIGFIIPIIQALILSSYYELLSDLTIYGKIKFNNFNQTFLKNFGSIYSVYFIIYLIKIVMSNSPVSNIIFILMFLAVNPIAESIYLRGENYTGAYTYSFNFMKENIAHWTLPLVIYLLIIYVVGGINAPLAIISNVVNIPIGINYLSTALIPFIIIEVITAIYAVFRAELFNILSKSTKRKRAYMGGLD